MNKVYILFSLLLLSHIAFAENCPSVDAIKSNKATGWQAYDSDDNKALTPARESRLRHSITQFALAELSKSHNKSMMHCYYKDQNNASLEAYFAKETTALMKPSKYWYAVTGRMECAAGADKCQFQTLPTMQHRLAQNERFSAPSPE